MFVLVYAAPKKLGPKSASMTTLIGVEMSASQRFAATMKASLACVLAASCEVA
jgi:hypothetical protein